jgi:3-methylcrotonyl-CoA carboxylase alpha subunit
LGGLLLGVVVGGGVVVWWGVLVLTLEAMKMEHSLVAPFDGKVAELNAAAGAQVSEGALLVRIEKAGE